MTKDPKWQCAQSGNCCSEPHEVVMTHAERDVLVAASSPRVTLTFEPLDDSRFVRLLAGPCPLYDASGKTCTVYDVRPFSCRRFACMRDDVATQRYDRPLSELRRDQRRQLVVIQRKAQRWGRAHGWSDDQWLIQA